MLKELVVGGLCMALLVGCNDSSEVQVGIVDQDAKATAEKTENRTALYLPGGTGVDFKRKPISDKVLEDKIGKIRIIQYEFLESYDVIDESVALILEAGKYTRKINPEDGNKLSVTYLKAGANPVLARYRSIIKGKESGSILTLSWRF